jgi:hypothetical protein
MALHDACDAPPSSPPDSIWGSRDRTSAGPFCGVNAAMAVRLLWIIGLSPIMTERPDAPRRRLHQIDTMCSNIMGLTPLIAAIKAA